ncbi:MAG: hypothetical protein QXF35_03780 [Candidatus Bilamarchaeaceae archaeon]
MNTNKGQIEKNIKSIEGITPQPQQIKKTNDNHTQPINKLHTYILAINYLYSLKNTINYYNSKINELEKEPGNKIQLISAKENLKTASEQLDKIIKELNEKSAGQSAEEIKNFVIQSTTKPLEFIEQAKELVYDYLGYKKEQIISRETIKNITESLPLVGLPTSLMNAWLEWEMAENKLNLYIIGSIAILGATIPAFKWLKKTLSNYAIQKLLNKKITSTIINEIDEFVQKIPKNVRANLTEIRNSIVYKDESIFEMLSKINKNFEELVNLNKDVIEMLATKNTKIFIIDKSMVWLLNNVDRKLGDLGLEVYFNAMKKLSDKGYVVRVTQIGDEIAILGSSNLKQEINKALEESANEIFKKYNLTDIYDIKKICSKASILEATVFAKNGKIYYTIGKEEKLFNIEELINDVELHNSIKNLSPKNKNKIIEFVKNLKETPSTIKLEKAIPGQEYHYGMKVVLEFEDQRILNAFSEMTLQNSKGVYQPSLNAIGPTTINQLGHTNTDYLTATVINELVKKGRITREEANKILQNGGLSYVIKEPNAKDIAKRVGTQVDIKIGNTSIKCKIFFGTPKEIEDKVTNYMLEKMGLDNKTAKMVVSLIEDINKTLAKWHLQKEDLPPWVRNAIAFIYNYISL